MVTHTRYSTEPKDAEAFRDGFDHTYTRIAGIYDFAVKALPVWKTWLKHALPHITGRRVLEVSFGTGYLMTRYAGRFEVYGIDLNARMVTVAMRNLSRAGLSANLRQGTVEDLPYEDDYFDTVVNTMAFSGYPSASQAMSEIRRVLAPTGRLVLIDINYPTNGNWLGTKLTHGWQFAGDLVRDMDHVFAGHGFEYDETEIGGFGSVHLYLCQLTQR